MPGNPLWPVVEVTLGSGLMLELAVCLHHADRVLEEFESLAIADEEQVA